MALPDDKQQDLRLSLPLSNEVFQPQKEVQEALFSRKNVLRVFLLFFASVTLYSQSAFLQQRFSPVFGKPSVSARFFYNITSPQGLCVSPTGHDVSHSGYIGLKGDTEDHPKRSFFWFFEAEQNAKDAPVILAFGGGPGTSGMMYATFGQSPCVISENGTIPNPHRWTEHYNLIILDHPVNVGFSYGTHVNNSHQAALDVYDFLQKFYKIYPDFLKNPFILAGGSYGGVYVPNIASVVYTENLAIRGGTGQPGAKHINLHSMMLSNPVVDPLSHFRWLPYYRCEVSGIYNETTCRNVYSGLPACLEAVDLSYKQSTVRHRVAALETCYEQLEGDTQGYILEDVRVKCKTDPADPAKCHPQFKWVNDFFTASSTRTALGIPDHVNFTSLNLDVNKEFSGYGDFVQPHSLLYEPLLRDGIRLLHYVGAQDANCAWPGVFSALKLIDSPFQEEFTTAPDLQWPANTEGVSTVRAVGPGAGSFTYFLVQNAGHFVVNNQRALVKQIVEHWIDNKPWFD